MNTSIDDHFLKNDVGGPEAINGLTPTLSKMQEWTEPTLAKTLTNSGKMGRYAAGVPRCGRGTRYARLGTGNW